MIVIFLSCYEKAHKNLKPSLESQITIEPWNIEIYYA